MSIHIFLYLFLWWPFLESATDTAMNTANVQARIKLDKVVSYRLMSTERKINKIDE